MNSLSNLLLLYQSPKKYCNCSSHQIRPRYVSCLLWKHSWVSSACHVFELHVLAGTALRRTEIKVLSHSGHQDGRYIIIKHTHTVQT